MFPPGMGTAGMNLHNILKRYNLQVLYVQEVLYNKLVYKMGQNSAMISVGLTGFYFYF